MLSIDTNVTIALIGSLTTVVLATINGFFAYAANSRSKRNEGHIVETRNAVTDIKRQTDGINDQLLKVTGEAEFAKGLKEGEGSR